MSKLPKFLVWSSILLFAISLAIFGSVLVGRKNASLDRDRAICRQIEKLKKTERQKENTDFSHLNRNLKLLHIKPTPHIIKVATQDHKERLAAYKQTDCP